MGRIVDGRAVSSVVMGSRNCLGETGMRVAVEQCPTCIFRPGNLMHLNAGRLAEMAREVKAAEGYVTCHQTLDLPLRRRVICRGSFDRFKTQIIQLAERMGFVEWVDLKEMDD